MGLAMNPQKKQLKPVKNEKYKSDVDVFLSGWSESQKISRIQKLSAPAQVFQDSDGLQKWQQNQEARFFTYFKMSRLRRLLKNQKKGSFAEGELAKLNDEKKSLVIRLKLITNS